MTNIDSRAVAEANYLLQNNSTIRQCANAFCVSKSTVHYDLSVRLKKCNYTLFKSVKQVLDKNFAQKHFRGGLATKEKYYNLKKSA